MTEPISLNKVRKARAKVAAKSKAEVNRVAFGRRKADKDRAQQEKSRAERALDGARRDPE